MKSRLCQYNNNYYNHTIVNTFTVNYYDNKLIFVQVIIIALIIQQLCMPKDNMCTGTEMYTLNSSIYVGQWLVIHYA